MNTDYKFMVLLALDNFARYWNDNGVYCSPWYDSLVINHGNGDITHELRVGVTITRKDNKVILFKQAGSSDELLWKFVALDMMAAGASKCYHDVATRIREERKDDKQWSYLDSLPVVGKYKNHNK